MSTQHNTPILSARFAKLRQVEHIRERDLIDMALSVRPVEGGR